MPDPVRVMIQLRPSPTLAATAFGHIETAPNLPTLAAAGLQLDPRFSPVPIPPRATDPRRPSTGLNESFGSGEPTTYVVRGTFEAASLESQINAVRNDPQVVGVFSDPRIQPIAAVCPSGPVGSDLDVEELLQVDQLAKRGMDGTGVRVAVVDTGINLRHLNARGKNPGFDLTLSWGPQPQLPLGDMPVDHGTMCAYDVCIAAPRCTLIDHALLTSNAPGGSVMEGFLSDAVKSYGLLLSWLVRAATPMAGDQLPRTLVVNNSWGMFHESWDFPVGDPANYSDNPAHPFNIIVTSVEAAGADILFAAGNCGPECPDGRCQGATTQGIFGANSSTSVISVAGVVITKERIGYSTKGPGRLDDRKPDLACYTHFAGSGVYPADGGTSAATPVAAGVVAAVRRLYPASVVSPTRMRTMLREAADPQSGSRFDHEYGYGVINVDHLLGSLEREIKGIEGVSKRRK